MNVETADRNLSRIAQAIAEPARTRMLCCLMDGLARTSTELAAIAEVTPSTASVHLARLTEKRLVKAQAQGKHRYYCLAGVEIARAIESLMIVAGGPREQFVPSTPVRLRAARTCYDHMAGELGVLLHDRLRQLKWLRGIARTSDAYELTRSGARELETLGVDFGAVRASRRRFAYACLDWSERSPHIGGALGAALLKFALARKWVVGDLDSRILSVTPAGRRAMTSRFGVSIGQPPV
jgi:DNA-binding transcriptional ArsR family regulator